MRQYANLVIGLIAALVIVACRDDPPEALDVPVRVGSVAIDRNNAPVVILQEKDGPRQLPIWIGAAEATSIALEMHKQRSPRPNFHDFAKRVIQSVDGRVERVVVTELRRGTYYASLWLRVGRRLIEIDVRPSDAIAVALRMEAPILVREHLFDQAGEAPVLDDSGQSVRYPMAPAPQSIGTQPATAGLML